MSNDDLDTTIREALVSLLARQETETPPFHPHPATAGRPPHRRGWRLGAAVLGVAILTAAFGGGYALGSSGASSGWPLPIRHVQRQVSLGTSAACRVQAATLSVSPTQDVSAGDKVAVTGPLYHLNEEGAVVVSADEDIQAWWGVDPTTIDAKTQDAIAIANGASPNGTAMVGDDKPNGACSFTLALPVPQVPAGVYPVSIVETGGGGMTLYGSFQVTVRSH